MKYHPFVPRQTQNPIGPVVTVCATCGRLEDHPDHHDLLEAYSRELDLYTPLTLERLIDSHRRLRAQSRDNWAEHMAQCDQIREFTIKQARETVEHGEYVAVSKLKTMTLLEVANFLADFHGD